MAGHYLLAGPAVVKSRQTNRWSIEDVSKIALNQLMQLYRQVELPITDFYGAEKTLYAHHYESTFRNSTLTLPQWLLTIGNDALTLDEGHPSLTMVETTYAPLTMRKGTFKMAKAGHHPSHEVAVEDYDDLIVTYEGIAPADLHLQCLFTINGLVLPTTYHQYGCRIKHAGDVIRKSSELSGGILDFSKIGTITQIPITEDLVHKVSEEHSYFDRLLINTKINVNNRTVGIVIGGHLHLLDTVVDVIGDTTVAITLRNSRYVERVLETQHALDLEMMGLTDIDSQSVMSHVMSDVSILRYLTSPYSFLVIINNPNMILDKEGVSHSIKLGGHVVPDTRPLSRLVDHLGRGIDYWPIKGERFWALNGTDSHRQTYMHQLTNWHQLVRMNDGAVPYRPATRIDPMMLHYKARIK